MHVDASDVGLLDVARLWTYVNETSGALTCYNFHSNSQIVAFFLVLTIYTCIYIFRCVDLLQFPFELAHNCIFSCVVHIFRCVNLLHFPSELTHHCIFSCVVHIVFFSCVNHTYMYIYIYIYALFDIIYISLFDLIYIYYDTCNMNAKVNVKP